MSTLSKARIGRHPFWAIVGLAILVGAIAPGAQITNDRLRLEKELRELATWIHGGDKWAAKFSSLQPEATVRLILLDWANTYRTATFENTPGGPPPSGTFDYLRLAVEALGFLKEPRASPVLVQLAKTRLNERDPIRIRVARSLGRIDAKGNQAALVEMLDSSSSPREGLLRVTIADILSESKDWAVLSKLEQLAVRENDRHYRGKLQAAANRLRVGLTQQK